ncbi:MAG: monovalent cation/H+ antiporter complex subunit F [Balneolales bacterium]
MNFFSIAIIVVYVFLSLSLLISLVRMIIGPTPPDRVVALDLIAFVVMGYIATYSISSGHPVYLDVAIALALIAFFGTVAFARYIFLRASQRREDQHV